MATATETLNKARALSKGMADWVDAQRAAGWSDHTICTMLREAAETAQEMRSATPPIRVGGRSK